MHIAARFEPLGQPRHIGGLDEAALVVAQFVPRVGEEDVDTVQAGGSQVVLDHLKCVVLHDADVVNGRLLHAFEQSTHARFMHLAA